MDLFWIVLYLKLMLFDPHKHQTKTLLNQVSLVTYKPKKMFFKTALLTEGGRKCVESEPPCSLLGIELIQWNKREEQI